MGLTGMLGVARDGLLAQSAALDTTGQNVANVNTPGYAKRTAVLASRAQPGSAGGVDVVTFARDAAGLASKRVYGEAGKAGAADARATALATIESLVSPSSGGLSDRMTAFFTSVTQLSADGNSTAARATVLSRANDLAASFSDTAAALNTERGTLLDGAKAVTQDVNQSLASIAKYNAQIAQSEAGGTPANDLRDARDVLVRGVADATGASVIQDDKGMMTVFVGGTAVVSGNTARSLSIDVDPSGKMKVMVSNPGGAPSDVTANATQGKLGGLKEARDSDIPAALKQLDQLAYDFSNQVNSVHSAGVGQDGVGGRNLFVVPAGVDGAAYAMKVTLASPNQLAAAQNAGELPGGGSVALALSKMATTSLAGGGTPSDRVTAMVSDIGTKAAAANDEAMLRAGTVSTAESNFESQRGVSLDEEMVNLTRYQRAFEASTKILHAADELLGDLIREL